MLILYRQKKTILTLLGLIMLLAEQLPLAILDQLNTLVQILLDVLIESRTHQHRLVSVDMSAYGTHIDLLFMFSSFPIRKRYNVPPKQPTHSLYNPTWCHTRTPNCVATSYTDCKRDAYASTHQWAASWPFRWLILFGKKLPQANPWISIEMVNQNLVK